MGEMLAELEKNKGGRPRKTSDTMSGVFSLPEIGIAHKDSSRWQQIAKIKEDDAEQMPVSSHLPSDIRRRDSALPIPARSTTIDADS
jgi:hypothetical protein